MGDVETGTGSLWELPFVFPSGCSGPVGDGIAVEVCLHLLGSSCAECFSRGCHVCPCLGSPLVPCLAAARPLPLAQLPMPFTSIVAPLSLAVDNAESVRLGRDPICPSAWRGCSKEPW